MIFEQFVFRCVTTLPPMITQARIRLYALQAFAVVATFCLWDPGIAVAPRSPSSPAPAGGVVTNRLNVGRLFARRGAPHGQSMVDGSNDMTVVGRPDRPVSRWHRRRVLSGGGNGTAGRARLAGYPVGEQAVRRAVNEVSMRATVGDVNPKTLENAKRQFVEVCGSPLVLNVPEDCAGAGGARRSGPDWIERLHGRSVLRRQAVVVRIDEVGRAETVLRRAALSAPAAGTALLPTQFIGSTGADPLRGPAARCPDSLLFSTTPG